MADEKKDNALDLHVMVFAGPNGSGKTSLIDEFKLTGLATVRGVSPAAARPTTGEKNATWKENPSSATCNQQIAVLLAFLHSHRGLYLVVVILPDQQFPVLASFIHMWCLPARLDGQKDILLHPSDCRCVSTDSRQYPVHGAGNRDESERPAKQRLED